MTTRRDITIGSFPAYHSYLNDGKKHPGLIIIHEIWGLVDHIKDVADRFANEGYSVVAPDFFHGMSFVGKIDQSLLNEMQSPETRDNAQKKMRDLIAPVMAPEFAKGAMTKLRQCIETLIGDEHTNGQIAVLGFCFGGTYSFHLAANDRQIKAAIPFYGRPPIQNEIPNIECPILAFYGDQDAGLMQSLPSLKEDMIKYGKKFECIVYQNAGHAFFNNTNARMYNSQAAKDAWEKTLAFLEVNLKG